MVRTSVLLLSISRVCNKVSELCSFTWICKERGLAKLPNARAEKNWYRTAWAVEEIWACFTESTCDLFFITSRVLSRLQMRRSKKFFQLTAFLLPNCCDIPPSIAFLCSKLLGVHRSRGVPVKCIFVVCEMLLKWIHSCSEMLWAVLHCVLILGVSSPFSDAVRKSFIYIRLREQLQ